MRILVDRAGEKFYALDFVIGFGRGILNALKPYLPFLFRRIGDLYFVLVLVRVAFFGVFFD